MTKESVAYLPDITSGTRRGTRSSARKRRVRSPHPGVVLISPKGESSQHRSWRARYTDSSGKVRKVRLEDVDARTAETRRAWAVRLSESLMRARSDLKVGVTRPIEDVPLTEAEARFFKAHPSLAATTVQDYRAAIALCLRGRAKLTTHGLTMPVLAAWRLEIVTAQRRVAARGGKRGEKAADKRVSPATANKMLRSIGRWLEWMRVAGLLKLSRDDLSAALRKERVLMARKPFLRPEQIAQLMSACARHDAASTRYRPITPVVRALLLTGARISELLAIEWRDVFDDRIIVRAEVSKTKREREIELHVSPTLLDGLTRGEPTDRVWNYTRKEVDSAVLRMVSYAPVWSPHMLRRTAGTYLTCAPSIYGGASAYMSARRLGHSVAIAEKHYTGALRISPDCKTLEAALGI